MPSVPKRRAGALAVVVALGALAAGCGRESRDEGPFAYDASRPLELVDRGIVDDDYPIAVHDVSFREHLDWLEERLGLVGRRVPGAKSGP